MKNAMIFHGMGGTPEEFWYPSIRKFLQEHGYEVWAPQLPEADTPNLKLQLPFVMKNGVFNEETILIGHSGGCPLILSLLEHIDVKVNKAILVSGFARKFSKTDPAPQKEEVEFPPILQPTYDWERIKGNVKDIIFINSDNDPWGCDDKEGNYMFRNLGGMLIIRHGEGHMGSNTFKQPYKEFPLLEKLLLP